MTTICLQLLNDDALRRLRELARLRIIKFVRQEASKNHPSAPKKTLRQPLPGKIKPRKTPPP